MTNVLANCTRCKKPIYLNDPYVCIAKNIEHINQNLPKRRLEVTVIHAEEIATFCTTCGNAFDEALLLKLINLVPFGSTDILNN